MKKIKKAVSVVILNEKDETLFALRSMGKKTFPGEWSLPTYFLKDGESVDEVIERIGKDKIGCKLKKVKFLKKGIFERESYILEMHVYLVKLVSGAPESKSVSYDKIIWNKAEEHFKVMEKFGACTTLYKKYLKK